MKQFVMSKVLKTKLCAMSLEGEIVCNHAKANCDERLPRIVLPEKSAQPEVRKCIYLHLDEMCLGETIIDENILACSCICL